MIKLILGYFSNILAIIIPVPRLWILPPVEVCIFKGIFTWQVLDLNKLWSDWLDGVFSLWQFSSKLGKVDMKKLLMWMLSLGPVCTLEYWTQDYLKEVVGCTWTVEWFTGMLKQHRFRRAFVQEKKKKLTCTCILADDHVFSSVKHKGW